MHLKLGETIPSGSVFVRRQLGQDDDTAAGVEFEVRTRGDATGQPQNP